MQSAFPRKTRRAILATAGAGLATLAMKVSAAQTAAPNTAAPKGGASQDQLDRVLASGVLRVAVPKEFPPFGYLRDGLPVGYDVAVARMLALELKVHLEAVPVASPERLPLLQDGKVDLIIASLGKTAEREQQIDFSMAYAPLYIGVFGPVSATPTTPDYFKGRRIGVTQGSLDEAELLRKLPAATVVRFENSAAIMDAYLKHEVEYMAVGNVVVESIKDVTARDRTKRVFLLKDSPCFIGVHKQEPRLLARVNRFLQEAGDSQALMVNAMVWFKATLPEDFFARRGAVR